jgi:hypothetical protein
MHLGKAFFVTLRQQVLCQVADERSSRTKKVLVSVARNPADWIASNGQPTQNGTISISKKMFFYHNTSLQLKRNRHDRGKILTHSEIQLFFNEGLPNTFYRCLASHSLI